MAVSESGDIVAQQLVSPKTTGPRRLEEMRDRTRSFLEQLPSVGHVCMEGYGYGTSMAHALGEGGAAIKLALLGAFSPPVNFASIPAPSQVKKFATGSGNAGKGEVMLAVYKRWGVEFKNDNLADAYVLAQIARHLMTGLPPETSFQRDVLATMRKKGQLFVGAPDVERFEAVVNSR